MRFFVVAIVLLSSVPAFAQQKNTEGKCTYAKCVAEGIKNGYGEAKAKTWCKANPGICTNTR